MIKKVLEYLTKLWYAIFRIDDLRVIFGVNCMREKYSALDIATWFIYKTNAEKKSNQMSNDDYEVYEGLTHLKLQKLLYYAQGICLANCGHVLFDDAIEAWEHGPVVRNVFKCFSSKGRNEITIDDAPSSVNVIEKIETDSEIREILNITYDNFAIYTAWQLRSMTHEIGTPWYKSYKVGLNKVISIDLIKKYFETEVMA